MVGGLPVPFPHEPYTEQLEYMLQMKAALDLKAHVLLEPPSGSGKAVAAFATLLAYRHGKPPGEIGKVVYCTRFGFEVKELLADLECVLGGGTSSNMAAGGGAPARSSTVGVAIATDETGVSVHTVSTGKPRMCLFDSSSSSSSSSSSTAEVKCEPGGPPPQDFGAVARAAVAVADVLILSYEHLLDPKTAIELGLASELKPETVVLFDAANCIDHFCIEAMSVTLKLSTLNGCTAGVVGLRTALQAEELRELARRPETKLSPEAGAPAEAAGGAGASAARGLVGPPVPLADAVHGLLPGGIRQARCFVEMLAAVLYVLKKKLLVRPAPLGSRSAAVITQALVRVVVCAGCEAAGAGPGGDAG